MGLHLLNKIIFFNPKLWLVHIHKKVKHQVDYYHEGCTDNNK